MVELWAVWVSRWCDQPPGGACARAVAYDVGAYRFTHCIPKSVGVSQWRRCVCVGGGGAARTLIPYTRPGAVCLRRRRRLCGG